MRRSVDFPQPERPTSVTNSFSPISRSMPSSARSVVLRVSKVCETPFRLIAVIRLRLLRPGTSTRSSSATA